LQFSKRNEYREYFTDRFGIPSEIMRKYEFFERGKSVWAFSGKYVEIEGIEAIGIRALRIGGGLKPSTAFLRVVGSYATKNTVILDENEALKYLSGEDIDKDFPVEPGYVIVRFEKDILGCGLYKGRLINQIPKKYRKMETWI
jgi:NOL1/NOP2/fmu family ribosome biogenesis protein